MFKNKNVVITGAAQGIGKTIKEEFLKNGANVYDIDIKDGCFYKGDISKKEVLEDFANLVLQECGNIDFLINNAAPLNKGISSCFYEEF